MEQGEEYDEEMHNEYQQEYECKSAWLHHFKLSDDLRSDPEGLETRPLSGLDAINFLDPGGLVKQFSWVFHHVTKTLMDVGYVEDQDLEAAPYDWRILPSMLETRDSYFSKTMVQIEQMYERNNEAPVVLLCHSIGCKTAHYLLNFAKAKEGQDWIDKYIHTYFPVSDPHLGAPKSMQCTIIGDKMGLDAFLSEEEGLICARSFGSVPWMFPLTIPQGMPSAAYLQREGVLHVTVNRFDCYKMFSERKHMPSKLHLDVTYNGLTLSSNSHLPQGENVKHVSLKNSRLLHRQNFLLKL